MAFKPVKLASCIVFALTTTCQHLNSLTNGNFACQENGTKVNAIGNYNECNKEDYSSIV